MKLGLKRYGLISLFILCGSCTHAVQSGVPSFPSPEVGPLNQVRAEAVEAQVKSKLRDLDLCYREEKLHNPTASGKIMLSFDVLADGQTTAVRLLASTLRSPVMEGCIVGKVEAWTFSRAAPSEPTHVRYPFSFQS